MQQFHTHTYNTQSQRQPFCNTAAQKRISRHLVNAPIRLPFGAPLWLCTKPSGGEGQVFSDCSAASCASLTAPSSSGKRSGWRPGGSLGAREGEGSARRRLYILVPLPHHFVCAETFTSRYLTYTGFGKNTVPSVYSEAVPFPGVAGNVASSYRFVRYKCFQ